MKPLLAAVLALVAIGGCASGPSLEIQIRYSRFVPAQVTVPAGVLVTFVLRNDDPIDHEWLVSDEEMHAVHRTGTEPIHGDIPTEVFVPALETRRTIVTFDEPGQLRFICHLPGHESYGMTGLLTVVRP